MYGIRDSDGDGDDWFVCKCYAPILMDSHVPNPLSIIMGSTLLLKSTYVSAVMVPNSSIRSFSLIPALNAARNQTSWGISYNGEREVLTWRVLLQIQHLHERSCLVPQAIEVTAENTEARPLLRSYLQGDALLLFKMKEHQRINTLSLQSYCTHSQPIS